jgi:hypothetical protein
VLLFIYIRLFIFMKKTSLIIGLSWIALLPSLIISGSQLLSQSLLFPLNICHQYNGNDFGSSALCTIPALSYFGYIFNMSGILTIPTIIGVVALLSYFGIIFVHNKRHPSESLKYSVWMIALAIIVFLPLFLSFAFS